MKKKLLILVLTIATVLSFGFEISAMGGMELGGEGRPYVGLRVANLKEILGVSYEFYFPLSSVKDAGNEIANIKYLQFNPFYMAVLPLPGIKIYAGAAPIIIFDISEMKFGFFSKDLFHAKAGLELGGPLVIFGEVLTAVDTEFHTSGIYSITGGIGISF